MEQPLFKDNVAEFDAYLSKLGKKVGKRITDYHVGGKVYFTHWAPSKAHASHLQISSPAAIDAEIAEARKSLESGAELFIGGHGGAAEADAVQFKIDYLKKMKEILGNSRTVQDFVDGMKKAFPGLPGMRRTDGREPAQGRQLRPGRPSVRKPAAVPDLHAEGLPGKHPASGARRRLQHTRHHPFPV